MDTAIADALTRILQKLAEAQAHRKYLAMVYQFDAKIEVAAHYGLTLKDVDLPFDEWKALREKYERETGRSL